MTTRQTFSINFYCRESKKGKKGLAPIEVCVITNGERIMLSLPRKEDPKTFNALISQKKNNEIKEYCEIWRMKIYEIQKQLLENNITPNSSNIKEYIQNGGIKEYYFEDLEKDFFNNLMSNKNVTLSTYKKYKSIIKIFKESEIYTNKIENVSKIDAQKFYYYLQSKYEQSTVSSMFTKIKCIFQFGVDSNKIKINPFKGIKVSKGEKAVEFLTDEEIEKIITTPMPTECYERVRDLFVYQLSTGQAYIDAINTTKEDIKENDGVYYICKKRQKTNQIYTTVILKDGVNVLKKYDYKLPYITNQKYNQYLKIVQGICGISKNLHSHIARHSFASQCLNKNIRLEIVSKMLGHSNLTQTQHYAKLLNKTIINEVTDAFK